MVDPSKKVPDLKCEVPDLLLELVDLKQQVPDLRSGGIPLNLTPAQLYDAFIGHVRQRRDLISCSETRTVGIGE